MGRYTGPNCKLCRREGIKLFLKGDRCLSPKCAVERRGGTPPGGAPAGRGPRQRYSQYAVQLREKQKLRRIYGVFEKQFRRHFQLAERTPGMTGETLLRILETRLDNVVYKSGFAASRKQARQLVGHGHVHLNGRPCNIPSAAVRVGDEVALTAKGMGVDAVKTSLERSEALGRPEWLLVDPQKGLAKVVILPVREQLESLVNERLIIEYFSR